MAKYQTGKNTARPMKERTVAEWSEHPYTSYERRSWEIQHRVVVETYDGDGVDVRHEVRPFDADNVSDEWTPAEVYEAREHGVNKITRAEGEEWWS